jgi:hypothetical protein
VSASRLFTERPALFLMSSMTRSPSKTLPSTVSSLSRIMTTALPRVLPVPVFPSLMSPSTRSSALSSRAAPTFTFSAPAARTGPGLVTVSLVARSLTSARESLLELLVKELDTFTGAYNHAGSTSFLVSSFSLCVLFTLRAN